METPLSVLWFGHELFVLNGPGLQRCDLPGKGDQVGAVIAAIEAVEPRPKAVRLIYQPGDLEHHAVDCVRGSRTLVRDTLGEDHPALRNPGAAWAISRLHPSESGYATLLWIDPRGRLNRLRTTLADRGIALSGAWPLTSVLERTAPLDDPAQPALAVVLTDTAGLVYAVTPGGARTVVAAAGSEFRGQLSGLVRNALSHFDAAEPPPVLVVEASSEPWDFDVGPLAEALATSVSMEQLVSAVADLRVRDLDNFLPPVGRVNTNSILIAAGAGLLCAALVNAGLYLREYRRVQNDAAIRNHAAQQLQASNARLIENRRKIEQLRALELEMNVEGAGRIGLLSWVMQHKPVEITIHGIAITGRSFEISGTAHEGTGKTRGPYGRFVDALAAKTNPWQIAPESRPASVATGEFVINGAFP